MKTILKHKKDVLQNENYTCWNFLYFTYIYFFFKLILRRKKTIFGHVQTCLDNLYNIYISQKCSHCFDMLKSDISGLYGGSQCIFFLILTITLLAWSSWITSRETSQGAKINNTILSSYLCHFRITVVKHKSPVHPTDGQKLVFIIEALFYLSVVLCESKCNLNCTLCVFPINIDISTIAWET